MAEKYEWLCNFVSRWLFQRDIWMYLVRTYKPKKIWIFAHVKRVNRNVKGLLIFISDCWNINTIPYILCFINVSTQLRFFQWKCECILIFFFKFAFYLIVYYLRAYGSHTMLMILCTFHFDTKKNLKIHLVFVCMDIQVISFTT